VENAAKTEKKAAVKKVDKAGIISDCVGCLRVFGCMCVYVFGCVCTHCCATSFDQSMLTTELDYCDDKCRY
jgi:hypothetical protein